MDEKLINLINKKFRSNLRTKCFINISKDSINSQESNHKNSINSKESNHPENSIDSQESNHPENSIDSREINDKITNSKRFIVLLLNNDNSLILLHLMIQRNLSRHSPSKSYYTNTNIINTSVTVSGTTDSNGPDSSNDKKDSTNKGTIGASTVTEGKGANSTAMKCTSEKIPNTFAVVTNFGESGTFTKDTKTRESGTFTNGTKDIMDTEGVNTKETPFGGAVGPSTVTVDIKNMLESDDLTLSTIINVQESSYDFIKNSNEIVESVVSILNKFTTVIITDKSESLTICSYKLNNYLTVININFCYFLHSDSLITRVHEECNEKCHELRENYKKLKKNPDFSTIIWNKLLYHNINKYFKSFSNNIYLLLSDCVEDICKITLLLTCLGLSESIINSTSYTNIINTSVTVSGTTDSNGPDSSNDKKDSTNKGTIGASTVTEGKGANSMGMKCTNIVNSIIVLRPLKTITQEQLLFYSKFYNIQNTKIQSNTVNNINEKMSITKCINDLISELTIQHNNSLYNIVNITNKLSNPNTQNINEGEEEKENEEHHSDEEEKKEFGINLKNYKQNLVNGYINKDLDKDVLKYFNEL